MNVMVRSAEPGEGKLVCTLTREFAEEHGDLNHFKAKPDDFEIALFGPRSVCGCEIAWADGEPASHIFWHRSFSTFRGKPSIYIEDILVREKHRRRGIAKALIRHLAEIANRDGLASIYWLMMEWNAAARDFYQSLGAEFETGFCYYRLYGEALQKLAAK
jgi:ribosomal protein S18 acetylase RimI-like enzyme